MGESKRFFNITYGVDVNNITGAVDVENIADAVDVDKITGRVDVCNINDLVGEHMLRSLHFMKHKQNENWYRY